MRSTKVISTVVIAAALIGPTGFHASAAVSDRDRPAKVSALKLLHHLRTAHERNAGYNRDKFADWLDRDGDGCDTRAEVLIDESLRRVRKGSGCYVRTGKWFSSLGVGGEEVDVGQPGRTTSPRVGPQDERGQEQTRPRG